MDNHARAWAKIVAKRNGIFPDTCPVSTEDLEQEFAVRKLGGRKSISGPMQDLARKEFGRAGESRNRCIQLHGDCPGKPVHRFRHTRPQRSIQDAPSLNLIADERRRRVIELYYWEGKSLKQIGEILGFNESRACQLHREALGILKQAMAHA